MKINISIHHHHHHHYPEIELMNQNLESLRAAVERNTSTDQSAIALIQGLVEKVDTLVANSTELAELKAGLTDLTGTLVGSTYELAAAVSANTPAAPVDPVPVDPAPVDENGNPV